MAKPRIFLSSTCYDLSVIRSELTKFLENYGFEVINSEKHSFGVTPGKHSHTACIEQVDNADYLLLLIGGRLGGTYIGSDKSITNEEYNRALKNGIPCIACVDRKVDDYRPTYKKNPKGDHSHIVDNVRIFDFIDYIASGHTDNWLHRYETIEHIQEIAKSQLAHYLFLFSQGLRKKEKKEEDISGLTFVDFPPNIEGVKDNKWEQEEEIALRNGLASLHKVFSEILKSDAKNDTKLEKVKCLWVFGKYGDASGSSSISMPADLFKQYAWSITKGKRVFIQFEPFGVKGWYDDDEPIIYIRFHDESDENFVACALTDYVQRLVEKYGDVEGYELFKRADMRCYMQ
jgi:hypothetical protein